jgi:hypothetical protein
MGVEGIMMTKSVYAMAKIAFRLYSVKKTTHRFIIFRVTLLISHQANHHFPSEFQKQKSKKIPCKSTKLKSSFCS